MRHPRRRILSLASEPKTRDVVFLPEITGFAGSHPHGIAIAVA